MYSCDSTVFATPERMGRCLPYMAHQLAGGIVLAFEMTEPRVKTPSFSRYLESSSSHLATRSITCVLEAVIFFLRSLTLFGTLRPR